MRLTIAYSKIKKRNLVLINNDTYQRETLSERPIRQPLRWWNSVLVFFFISVWEYNKIVIDIVSLHAYLQIISRGHGFRSETCDKEKQSTQYLGPALPWTPYLDTFVMKNTIVWLCTKHTRLVSCKKEKRIELSTNKANETRQ